MGVSLSVQPIASVGLKSGKDSGRSEPEGKGSHEKALEEWNT